MKPHLYPLVASKILRHCEIFLITMKKMEAEELVELAFNEFVANADRTIQYLQKELNKIGGCAPNWFRNKRENLRYRALFYDLRHIIAHHFFIPLTPILAIHGDNVPPEEMQLKEMRLDLEMLPQDKKFDKNRKKYIEEVGASINAVELSESYFNELATFVREAETRYGNTSHYRRNKVKSSFRVNKQFTLRHYEREY